MKSLWSRQGLKVNSLFFFQDPNLLNEIKESKCSLPSLLAHQICLCLIAAEGSDTPRGCNNIVVSIHAIATFQALNDYLHPRLSGLLSSVGGSRLLGVLVALAAGHILGPFLHNPPDSSQTPPTKTDLSSAPNGAASSSSAPTVSDENKPQHRRSQRLSAKASAINNADQVKIDGETSSVESQMAAPSLSIADMPPPDSMTEVAASKTAVNDDEDEHDDFMDADVDAEVQ